VKDLVQRNELAAFLRARRETTDPVSFGLQPGSRRRTPGLRREELAQLAGISVTWYTWLEQARDISVSRQVIDSLARVLRLPPGDRAHLFTVAGLALPAEQHGPVEIDGTLRRLVHTLDPNPACVISLWWDLLGWNQAYAALIGGLEQRPPAERNTLWLTFTEERSRRLFLDWTEEARQLLGQLRAHLARHPGDPRGPELVETLQAASGRFTELWRGQDVRRFESARKRFQHPGLGRIDLDYVKLATADDDRQYLLAFLPADAASAAKLPGLIDGGRDQGDGGWTAGPLHAARSGEPGDKPSINESRRAE
jgi:transcriptional regulator with XRE-family HTH domain